MGLYTSSNFLDQLRNRLVGKTVMAVDPPGDSEAVATFTTSDNRAFRLYANDLGCWLQDTVAKDSRYHSLKSMFLDYGIHQDSLFSTMEEVPPPTVEVTADVLLIISPTGKVFEGDISSFNLWEISVCRHPQTCRLISQAAERGTLWTGVFRLKEECPPGLCLTPQMLELIKT